MPSRLDIPHVFLLHIFPLNRLSCLLCGTVFFIAKSFALFSKYFQYFLSLLRQNNNAEKIPQRLFKNFAHCIRFAFSLKAMLEALAFFLSRMENLLSTIHNTLNYIPYSASPPPPIPFITCQCCHQPQHNNIFLVKWQQG